VTFIEAGEICALLAHVYPVPKTVPNLSHSNSLLHGRVLLISGSVMHSCFKNHISVLLNHFF